MTMPSKATHAKALKQASEHIKAGRLAEAEAVYRDLIDTDPQCHPAFSAYGEICRRMGRSAEAIEFGTRACGLAPDDIDAHFNLALACSDANLSVRVEAIYEKVLKLIELTIASGTASAAMWERRAFVLLRLNRHDEARQSRERALKQGKETAAH